jgi:hypothetical protein
MKRPLVAIALIWTPAQAEGLSVNPTSLPAFNVMCYRIIITNFGVGMPGHIVMSKADDEARYNLYTANGQVLKVVNNPESAGLRQEYGPIVDPAKRPPVFTWFEKSSLGLRTFSYEAKEKVLSVVNLPTPNKRFTTVNTNEVLRCRDK